MNDLLIVTYLNFKAFYLSLNSLNRKTPHLDIGIVNRYVDAIKNAITQKLTLPHQQVTDIFQKLDSSAMPYISEVEHFLSIDGLLSRYPENNPRRILIEFLMGKEGYGYEKFGPSYRSLFLGEIRGIDTLSKLFFNDESYLEFIFLLPSAVNGRPTHTTLLWMKNVISNWNGPDLQTLGVDLDHDTLESLKSECLDIVNIWMENNFFNSAHLAENSNWFLQKYGQDVQRRELALIDTIRDAFAYHENDPKITFEKIKALSGARRELPSALTTDDYTTTIPDLNKIVSTLKNFNDDEYLLNPLAFTTIYESAIEQVYEFLDHREKSIKRYLLKKYRPSPSLLSRRSLFLNDEPIKAFDNLMLLGRDIGFDFIFFDNLEDTDFIQGMNQIMRHHRNPSSWWSLYVSGMMLTNRQYHGVYSGTEVSSKDSDVLLEGFQRLIKMGVSNKGSGTNGLISEADIKLVFSQLNNGVDYTLADGRTVLEWWKQGSSTVSQSTSFQVRLSRFNDRVLYLRSGNTIKQFIYHYYRTAYNRFWEIGVEENENYVELLRMGKPISSYISIPDLLLMRKVFGVQMGILNFI